MENRIVLGSNGKTNRLQRFLNTFQVKTSDRFSEMLKRREALVKKFKHQPKEIYE